MFVRKICQTRISLTNLDGCVGNAHLVTQVGYRVSEYLNTYNKQSTCFTACIEVILVLVNNFWFSCEPEEIVKMLTFI